MEESTTVGLVLLIYGVIGLSIYIVVSPSMVMIAKNFIGFRYLLSHFVAEGVMLFQFSVWPAIVVLRGETIFPRSFRRGVWVYLDFVWWAASYNRVLVAWSRVECVLWPWRYRKASMLRVLSSCALAWFAGFVTSAVSNAVPGFEIMYLDPHAYGYSMENFTAYTIGGTKQFYSVFNAVLNFLLPFACYAVVLGVLLWKKFAAADRVTTLSTSDTDAASTARVWLSEVRLIVPCMISNVVCVAGQVAIMEPFVEIKWIGFTICVVLGLRTFAEPLSLLIFSSVLRTHVYQLIRRSKARY